MLRSFRMGSAEYASAFGKLITGDCELTEAEQDATDLVNGKRRDFAVPMLLDPTVFDPEGVFFHRARLN